VGVGTAEEGLTRLKQQKDLTKIDLLFIDHVEKLYKQEFRVARALYLFRKGTVIVADNGVRAGRLSTVGLFVVTPLKHQATSR
jgi:catechol O-methyltransferase